MKSKMRGELFVRRGPWLQPRQKILIVCEGSKTEKIYFTAIRRELRLTATAIEVVGGDEAGTAPKSIVEHAKALNSAAKRRREPFASTWCVFDRDDHLRIEEAFQQAEGNGYNIAFSNPCFELWYLLHFQDQGAEIHRDNVARQLLRHLPKYAKGVDVSRHLIPIQAAAVTRAKKLRDYHKRAFEPVTKNPSTSVDMLVGFLNAQRPVDDVRAGSHK